MSVAATEPRRDAPLPGDVQILLHNVGLRSTRQRIALASLLLRTANRRVSAESLYGEAHEARCPVSRATGPSRELRSSFVMLEHWTAVEAETGYAEDREFDRQLVALLSAGIVAGGTVHSTDRAVGKGCR